MASFRERWPERFLLALCLVLLGWQGWRLQALEEGLRAERSGAAEGEESRGMLYVAAYSHVYDQAGLPLLMGTSLSVRNTDLQGTLTLEQVDYYDNHGTLLRRYLGQPRTLEPMQSAEFLVEESDFAGGMGANFIVRWRAQGMRSAPLAEALMVRSDPGRGLSFTSHGVSLESDEERLKAARLPAGP